MASKTIRALVRLLCIPLLLAAPSAAATAEQWRTRSIYQLLTDRFAVSNPTASPACNTSAQRYCGGSWKGITAHLDYIQGMGFDAVWISPVVANIAGNTPHGEAYHGYWAQNLSALNPNFGSPADLQALSSALHARDMYLMLDVVANHMGSTGGPAPALAPPPPSVSNLAPFNKPSDFHPFCFINSSNGDANQTELEQCWLGDAKVPLPDLDTEDERVVDGLYAWVARLVADTLADGVRIDTVKHVRKDFWPDFARSAAVFALGEVLSGDVSYTAAYTQVLDGILDYPTYFAVLRAFASPSGNLTALKETVVATQRAYKNGAIGSGSFVENHDQPRIQSMTSDQALVKNAITWPFVQDGIPILYYGQEQGYTGGAVPSNREALWFTAYETNKPLVAHVKALNAARKLAIDDSMAFITTPLKFLRQSNSSAMIAVSKAPLVALLTNVGGSSTRNVSWTCPNGTFEKNQALVDVLTCNRLQATVGGGLTVQAKNGLPQVLLPVSMLSTSGSLCPSMATGSAITIRNVWGWVTTVVVVLFVMVRNELV